MMNEVMVYDFFYKWATMVFSMKRCKLYTLYHIDVIILS